MKRIICLLLSLSIVFGINSAFAMKRPVMENVEKTENDVLNIVPGGGHFNNADEVSKFGVHQGELSWVADSAVGDGGCMKVNITKGYGFPKIEIPNVIGETYDISFYAKADKPGTLSFIIRFKSGGYRNNPVFQDKYTTGWKKYTCSYTCDGLSSAGKDTTSLYLFDANWNSGGVGAYYLDELVVTPRGESDYDFVSSDFSLDVTKKRIETAGFTDISSHWADDAIKVMAGNSYIKGYEDNTYRPDGNITRAEFVSLLSRFLNMRKFSYVGGYRDVKSGDWFADDLQLITEANLIPEEMIKEGYFSPDVPINREEAVYILTHMLKSRLSKKQEAHINTFNDESEISEWAKNTIYEGVGLGLINGFPDGTFQPQAGITRGECASIQKFHSHH